jgi:hypothetical protein
MSRVRSDRIVLQHSAAGCDPQALPRMQKAVSGEHARCRRGCPMGNAQLAERSLQAARPPHKSRYDVNRRRHTRGQVFRVMPELPKEEQLFSGRSLPPVPRGSEHRPALLGLLLSLLCVFLLLSGAHAGYLDLTWNAPTTNADGSPLTDLANYRVYSGTASPGCPGGAFQTVPSGTAAPSPGTTVAYTLTGLVTGATYLVQVTAVDNSGRESSCPAATSGTAKTDTTSTTDTSGSLSSTSTTGISTTTSPAGGSPDFNGDGKPDILWQNQATGAVTVWYMNGATKLSYAYIVSGMDLSWKVVGAADFNGDGKPDILWQNKSTGAVEVWYMNGKTELSSAWIVSGMDLNWKVVAPN